MGFLNIFKQKPNEEINQFIEDVIDGKIVDPKLINSKMEEFRSMYKHFKIDDYRGEIFRNIVAELGRKDTRSKSKTNSVKKYGKWIEHDDYFTYKTIAVGVTYDNHQVEIGKLRVGDDLDMRYYDFEGDPAVEFKHNGASIGYLPADEAEDIHELNELNIIAIVKKLVYLDKRNATGVDVELRIDISLKNKLVEI